MSKSIRKSGNDKGRSKSKPLKNNDLWAIDENPNEEDKTVESFKISKNL